MLPDSDPSLLSAGFKMLWGLFVVLGILLIIYGLLRKKFSFAKSNSDSRIKICEIRHIMPKKSLCLIEVDGREYLIGIGNETISLLSPIEKCQMPSFSDTLNSASRHDDKQKD